MAEIATLTFKAKRRDDIARWTPREGGGSDYSEGHTAYAIPALTSAHVATPRTAQGTRHVLHFGPSAPRDLAKRRTESVLKRNGLDPYYVYADDTNPAVTIEPIGNGFMARITLTLDLSAR